MQNANLEAARIRLVEAINELEMQEQELRRLQTIIDTTKKRLERAEQYYNELKEMPNELQSY
jgi:hypothetical protein